MSSAGSTSEGNGPMLEVDVAPEANPLELPPHVSEAVGPGIAGASELYRDEDRALSVASSARGEDICLHVISDAESESQWSMATACGSRDQLAEAGIALSLQPLSGREQAEFYLVSESASARAARDAPHAYARRGPSSQLLEGLGSPERPVEGVRPLARTTE